MRIDLHVHSNASDGTDPPEAVVRQAFELGLDGVGLTDHDTVAGHAAAVSAVHALAGSGAGPSGDARPFVVVPGAEISCTLGGTSLHLLAYLFDVTDPELVNEFELLRTDRVRRAHAMVDKLVELGAPISWAQVCAIAGNGVVGRPHVARALVAAGVIEDVSAAFTPTWIGDGGRAYVDKYALAPTRAIAMVRSAGGVTVFAHPAASARGDIVGTAEIEALAAAGLDGLEVDHPDHDEPTRQRLRDIADDLGLLVTGSSDYHGSVKSTKLGANTTAPEMVDVLIDRATGGQVIST
jgi:predicted metal-dependent phosphoesterase TrpH